MKRKSDVQKAKDKVQAVLLRIVRIRDGGCVFRKYPGIAGLCGGITTADHIITRERNSTFAYLPNLVCTCVRHHLGWKPTYPTIWTDAIKEIIGEDRYREIHERAKIRQHSTATYWLKVEAELKKQLEQIENGTATFDSTGSIVTR